MNLQLNKHYRYSLSNGWNYSGELIEIGEDFYLITDDKKRTPVKLMRRAIVSVEEE